MSDLAPPRSRNTPRLSWGPSRLAALVPALSALLLAPAAAGAQHAHGVAQKPGGHESSAAAPRPGPHVLSAKAREQIAEVERAVAALKTPDTLRTGGFRPVFGMIPTMGVHWVHMGRMLDDVKLLEPDQLLFSNVGGEPRLMGVAYAFLGQVAEAPDLFDGDQDAWHAHPELAPPGLSVVMLHVWFVPSPDGPFAGHNPWLAYWAAGVEPPADSLMAVPTAAPRVRQLALALAEALEPLNVAQVRGGGSALAMAIAQVRGDAPAQSSDSALPAGIAARRDSLRAAIPRLNAARRAADQSSWDREADAAIAVWKRVRDAYLEAIPPGDSRDRLAAFYQQMATGGHAH